MLCLEGSLTALAPEKLALLFLFQDLRRQQQLIQVDSGLLWRVRSGFLVVLKKRIKLFLVATWLWSMGIFSSRLVGMIPWGGLYLKEFRA